MSTMTRSLSRRSARSTTLGVAACCLAVALGGCAAGNEEVPGMSSTRMLALRDVSSDELARLSTSRIFFGHQSVGYNIVEGLRDVMKSDSRVRLNISESRSVADAKNGGFLHAAVGRNVFPAEKDSDFVSVLDGGFGRGGDIALYKYCYVDVQPGTRAAALFQEYKRSYESARSRYPELTIVHVTMPLMVSENSLKSRWMLWRMGYSQRALNVIRNEFNRLLLAEYGSSGLVFDLAALESTRPDGSRAMYVNGADSVYSLVPEYTFDGGHLNEAARKLVAEQLIVYLARTNAARAPRDRLVGGTAESSTAPSVGSRI